MDFPPQCTKRWQLYEQMSRVLKMCEKAGFDRPWECVKSDGRICTAGPFFNVSQDRYEFALAIVEGRPVFRGNVQYNRNGIGFTVAGLDGDGLYGAAIPGQHPYIVAASDSVDKLSWNPPQRTIKVNGVKVKAPVNSRVIVHHSSKGVRYSVETAYGDSESDAEAFKAALEGK